VQKKALPKQGEETSLEPVYSTSSLKKPLRNGLSHFDMEERN
jgi:hypothetical protein